MSHIVSVEMVSQQIQAAADELPSPALRQAVEATERAAGLLSDISQGSPLLVEARDLLGKAIGHAVAAQNLIRGSVAHAAAYVAEITGNTTGDVPDHQPSPDKYGREATGWWKPEMCFHMVELRALGNAAAEMAGANSEQAAAFSAMGLGMQQRCEGMRAASQQATCPLLAQLASLSWYVEHTKTQRLQTAVERAARLRKYPLNEAHTELVTAVDAAAAEAYFMLSRASGSTPHNIRRYPGNCAKITVLMQQILRLQGQDTQLMEYNDRTGFAHFFLRITAPDGEILDVDGTWQQSLPEDTKDEVYNNLPHVLILPGSQRQEALEAHGVPEQKQRLWQRARPSNTQWWEFRSIPLGRIFVGEGWV
jgi:hypothetical protein